MTSTHEKENVSGDVGASSHSDFLSEPDRQEGDCNENIVIATHEWFIRDDFEYHNQQGDDGEIVDSPDSLPDARSAKIKIAQRENVPIKFVTLTRDVSEHSGVDVGDVIEGISKF